MTTPADPRLSQPPAPDELEVTLFGPGVGECVVVHLGDGAWAVVDSCLWDGEPAALRYLRAMDIHVDQVRCVVVTHWHDDHHRGVSRILEACPEARFHCSIALRAKEAFTLFATPRGMYDPESGIEELHRVLALLAGRSDGKPSRVGPRWLKEGERFLCQGPEGGLQTELWALSPSSAACTEGLHALAKMIPAYRDTKLRAVASDANHVSVAIQVKRGTTGVLLGSDLEEHGSGLTGWSGAIANHENVGGRSLIFKVPHHGSANGHHEGQYEVLLEPGPIGLLTPYRRSKLPRESDVARLAARCQSVHLTAPVAGRKLPNRPGTVERILRSTARDHRSEYATMGIVRVRIGPSGQPSIEEFGAASQAAKDT